MLPLIIPALAVAGAAYFIFKEDKDPDKKSEAKVKSEEKTATYKETKADRKEDKNDDKQLAENAGDKRSGGGDNTTDNEGTPEKGLTPPATSENDDEASISGADIEPDLNESDTENEHEVSG